MAESIKDKVAIVGMACTKFGERWDADIKNMITEAADEACKDAGVELKDIQAIWQGSQWGSQIVEGGVVTGTLVSITLQTQYIPLTRVENACGTGAESLRGATFALAAKGYDLVMALGVEKCKDMGFGGLPSGWIGRWEPVYGAFGTGPGRYAMAAVAYFAKYGLSNDEGKRVLAEISVKSHFYGAKNPKAHLTREVTVCASFRGGRSAGEGCAVLPVVPNQGLGVTIEVPPVWRPTRAPPRRVASADGRRAASHSARDRGRDGGPWRSGDFDSSGRTARARQASPRAARGCLGQG